MPFYRASGVLKLAMFDGEVSRKIRDRRLMQLMLGRVNACYCLLRTPCHECRTNVFDLLSHVAVLCGCAPTIPRHKDKPEPRYNIRNPQYG